MKKLRAYVAPIILVMLISSLPGTAAKSFGPVPERAHALGAGTSPAATGQTLVSAWRTKNRSAAAQVASSEAIDKLFSVRWRAMRFRGCSHREEGGVECRFYDRKNDLGLAMLLERTSRSYRVTSVSFSSEAL